MSETISLYDPKTDITQVGRILNRQLIPGSGEKPEKIQADFSGDILSLVCKKAVYLKVPPSAPILGGRSGEHAGKLYEIWRRLTEADLPVVQQAWIANRYSVAFNDLTIDGGNIYDMRDLRLLAHNERDPLPTDPLFLSINRDDIEDSVMGIIDRANQQSIALAFDDPMALLVKPDGDFKIYLLDIGITWFDNSAATVVNIDSAKRFMRVMDRTKHYLQQLAA